MNDTSSKYPAYLALQLLDGDLASKLPIERIDPKTRSKAHFFRVTTSGKQFALLVGDFDTLKNRFDRDDSRVLLEDLPPSIEGVVPVPIGDYYNGGTVRRTFSRLAPPTQRSVYVESESAFRRLMGWYSTHSGATAAAPIALPRPIPISQPTAESSFMSRNLILYGPPGTGKTYETAMLAVELCDGTAPQHRDQLMTRYRELQVEKRIAFVTFHQSYGYEDFVEGLRPEAVNGQVRYDVRRGVFREICDAARRSASIKPGLAGKPLKQRAIYKMSLGVAGSSEGKRVFQESVEGGRILLGWGDDVDFSDCSSYEEIKKCFLDAKPEDQRVESNARYVNVLQNELKDGDLVVASQGNYAFKAVGEVVGPYEFYPQGTYQQSRPVRWLATFEANRPVSEIYGRNFSQSSLYRLDEGAVKYPELQALIGGESRTNGQAFVLIIDEINRANISKVFGELITLIEHDKREGAVNALSVTLPYSGDDFSVPSNLSIIGTMNTADRSIALLDTALRRRFEFRELMPRADLIENAVEGVDIQAMLKAINERIEALYDRDHAIGHAYFMGISTLEQLEQAFRDRIIPLLQEYFHEDWSKVRRVLNDSGNGQFIRRTVLPAVPVDGGELIDDESRPVYRVVQDSFPLAAYRNIYGA